MKFLSYQISDLFNNPTSPLGKIVERVQAIAHCQDCFTRVLGEELSRQCRLGQYENGVITLFTHSGAVATQLRFQVPQLLSQLREDKQFAALRSIQVKVAQFMPSYTQDPQQNKANPPAPLVLSQRNAEILRQLAEGLSENDPATQKLAASLSKLAERSRG